MNDAAPVVRRPRGVPLFYQIAVRLIVVAVLFALLNVIIVVAMYVNDRATLSEDLISLESRRIADSIREHGIPVNAGSLIEGSSTRAVTVFDGSGKQLLLFNPGHVPLPEAPLGDMQSTTTQSLQGGQFFLTGLRRFDSKGEALWVGVAIFGEGLSPLLPALYQEVYEHALLPLIPLAILLLIFNAVVVRRMLRPLERAVADVNALKLSDLSRRVHQPDSPLEVSSLLGAFNRALGRLERAMQTLRQFTADAAHELRTPLAAMTLTIGNLPASSERQKLRDDASRMTRLIAQMLDLARTDALDDAQRSRSDLNDIATRVATNMVPVAISQGKSIRYINIGSSVVAGSSELLERALRNLIENALVHTPPATEVDVVVGPKPEIQVRDHGPGIPPELRELVFTRFWRADQQRGGAGLGLAITRSIMDACGGSVHIGDADGGGAVVTLVFPKAIEVPHTPIPSTSQPGEHPRANSTHFPCSPYNRISGNDTK
jgi:signal transduction histidine kinase